MQCVWTVSSLYSTIMYEHLNNIGLENYIKKCCGGKTHEDSWLRGLDTFVGRIEKDSIEVLRLKFSKISNHSQITDTLNEVMVACIFHPLATFIKEGTYKTPDLYDKSRNVYVEIKSLNEGDDEKERHKSDSFLDISRVLSETEKSIKKQKILENIYKKACDHFSKATCQLNNQGIIYLVYDYNLFFRDKTGTNNQPCFTNTQVKIVSQNDVLACIRKATDDFIKIHPCISISPVYFGELRNRIIELYSSFTNC